MQNRVAFLVDGFNVYYSILDAINDLGGISLKWLNLRAFCESYLHLFGPKPSGERCCLEPDKPCVGSGQCRAFGH